MSFKINDLVIHITREAQGCPPRSCFNTDYTGFVKLEDALAKEGLPLEIIRENLNAQIITDPTPEDLTMLEDKLLDALEAVRSKMK